MAISRFETKPITTPSSSVPSTPTSRSESVSWKKSHLLYCCMMVFIKIFHFLNSFKIYSNSGLEKNRSSQTIRARRRRQRRRTHCPRHPKSKCAIFGKTSSTARHLNRSGVERSTKPCPC